MCLQVKIIAAAVCMLVCPCGIKPGFYVLFLAFFLLSKHS